MDEENRDGDSGRVDRAVHERTAATWDQRLVKLVEEAKDEGDNCRPTCGCPVPLESPPAGDRAVDEQEQDAVFHYVREASDEDVQQSQDVERQVDMDRVEHPGQNRSRFVRAESVCRKVEHLHGPGDGGEAPGDAATRCRAARALGFQYGIGRHLDS